MDITFTKKQTVNTRFEFIAFANGEKFECLAKFDLEDNWVVLTKFLGYSRKFTDSEYNRCKSFHLNKILFGKNAEVYDKEEAEHQLKEYFSKLITEYFKLQGFEIEKLMNEGQTKFQNLLYLGADQARDYLIKNKLIPTPKEAKYDAIRLATVKNLLGQLQELDATADQLPKIKQLTEAIIKVI